MRCETQQLLLGPNPSSQASGPLTAAQFLTLAADAGLSAERIFVPGAGLVGTDGGAGGNYTLDVGGGSGIAISANDISVDASVARNTWAVNAGAGLTGGGTLAAAGITLDVVGGNGITVAANSVSVDEFDPFAWTGAQTWANTSTFNGIAAFTANIGSHLIPNLTDTYDLGSALKLWRKGWLSELDAVLFAQNVVSVIGGWLMVAKGEGTADADIPSAAGPSVIDLGVIRQYRGQRFYSLPCCRRCRVYAGYGRRWRRHVYHGHTQPRRLGVECLAGWVGLCQPGLQRRELD